MTVKELKVEYDYVVYEDGKYYVHSKNGKRSVYKYLATVIKKGRSMFVEGCKPTTKMDVLKKQIGDYVSSLKYDSEYYNPRYREGYKEYMIVNDYLDSIGFQNAYGIGSGLAYDLKRPSIYGYQATVIRLYISGLDDLFELSNEVDVQLATGDSSWMSTKCARNEDEIIKTIDGLLKPLLLTETTANIKTSEDMGFESVDVVLKKLNGLNVVETDVKSYLKKELQVILDKL